MAWDEMNGDQVRKSSIEIECERRQFLLKPISIQDHINEFTRLHVNVDYRVSNNVGREIDIQIQCGGCHVGA